MKVQSLEQNIKTITDKINAISSNGVQTNKNIELLNKASEILKLVDVKDNLENDVLFFIDEHKEDKTFFPQFDDKIFELKENFLFTSNNIQLMNLSNSIKKEINETFQIGDKVRAKYKNGYNEHYALILADINNPLKFIVYSCY